MYCAHPMSATFLWLKALKALQGTFGVEILPKDFRHRGPSVWLDSNPRSRG